MPNPPLFFFELEMLRFVNRFPQTPCSFRFRPIFFISADSQVAPD